MDDLRFTHLSEEQLGLYQDGERTTTVVNHLQHCPNCAERLRDLHNAAAAYAELTQPEPGSSTPRPWPSLSELIAGHESRRPRRSWWPALGLVAAAACAAAVVFLFTSQPRTGSSDDDRMNQLLSVSERPALPARSNLSLRFGNRVLVRPAVLSAGREQTESLAHLQTLFNEAHYDWQAPLSARSYRAWRDQLPHRRDTVTVLNTGSAVPSYRVQTETEHGVLRSASLVLRGPALHPVNGQFLFAGELPVTMEETSETAPPTPATASPTETPATPADTLHVLAALNAIGADVGEPIELNVDAHQQLEVRLGALNPERKSQVTEALRHLPRIRISSQAAPRDSADLLASHPEHISNDLPEAMRQRFETQLGGPARLQERTDQLLDAGASLVAQAHALQFLSLRFPPAIKQRLDESDRQLLRRLRHSHTAELQRLTQLIRRGTTPLPLPHETAAPVSVPAGDLITAAQSLDELLNRLLAGSYTVAEGDELLREVNGRLSRLESSVAAAAKDN